MKRDDVVAYIFAALLLGFPVGWTVLMHRLGRHDLDFGPKIVLIFGVLAVLVGFAPRMKKLLDGMKASGFGITIEDKQDGNDAG